MCSALCWVKNVTCVLCSPVILDEKLTNLGKKTYRAEFFRIDAKYSHGQHTKSPQKSPQWQIKK